MTFREISAPAARVAIVSSADALILLASLHVVSGEFDPSWRMVSEYANGQYGWILSLMFLCWGAGSWALAYTIWPQVRTTGGKIGAGFLVAAGAGEAMASVFDINHDVMHGVAGMLGVGGLPIAAVLIGRSLSGYQPWSKSRKTLLWTGHLTWVSLVLLAGTFAVFLSTHTHGSGATGARVVPKVLHPAAFASVGWANRLLVVIYCLWVMTVSWKALGVRGRTSEGAVAARLPALQV